MDKKYEWLNNEEIIYMNEIMDDKHKLPNNVQISYFHMLHYKGWNSIQFVNKI